MKPIMDPLYKTINMPYYRDDFTVFPVPNYIGAFMLLDNNGRVVTNMCTMSYKELA
jgi:hypothetical protein